MVPSSQALAAAPVCKRQSAHCSAPVIMIGRLYLVVIWSMYLRHGSDECNLGEECRLQAASGCNEAVPAWLVPGATLLESGNVAGRVVVRRLLPESSLASMPQLQRARQLGGRLRTRSMFKTLHVP